MNPPSFLSSSLAVAIGGGFGAWLRYGVGRLIGTAGYPFPWPTLTVNLAGSLAMGLLAGWLARHGQGGEQWRLLLGVGMLGGFTTFSAFSLELFGMIQRGSHGMAALYAALSVIGGVIGLFIGLGLMRVAA
ncbi:fluoride efflux transporter CrcB [Novosphingobium sp.]|uniref:fluoride efflux transporter CrcB n=1 Tax=Novosphingobium sp. TaxID=1874826 RepID=UPI0025D5D855|nr:fluoride efflux transporter CrcB [Novosphingobium sp.]